MWDHHVLAFVRQLVTSLSLDRLSLDRLPAGRDSGRNLNDGPGEREHRGNEGKIGMGPRAEAEEREIHITYTTFARRFATYFIDRHFTPEVI